MGVKLEKYTMTAEELGGDGLRLGACCRLADGEMVYVPDAGANNEPNATPIDRGTTID